MSADPSVAHRAAAILADSRPVTTQAAALYLDLHAHPELSGAERRTAGQLAAWLAHDRLRVVRDVGGHGVVGVLENGPGPSVLLRAELDALPVAERTGLPYASTVTGIDPDGRPVPVAHACGHDLHLAALAGAARLLAGARDRWRGTLLVVGQPAEETLYGARAMLDDGLYQRFGRPDAVLAQHTAPIPAGMVAHGAGAMLAGSRTFEVVIHGRGGHVATPHLTVDPIAAAAGVILRSQAIVAREAAPGEPAVVSVGSVRAGSRSNIVPDEARLDVTLRALRPDLLDRLAAALDRIVRAECAAAGCTEPPELRVVAESPVTEPDPALTAAVRAGHEELLGTSRVTTWPPSLATEDFPYFATDGVPVAYWMLGSVGPRQWSAGRAGGERGAGPAVIPGNHSPRFAPQLAGTLSTGIAALVTAALTRLGPGAPPD
ncbi:amidohydrolase [Plantactinospora mayteni]|uniref:Hippurate hydrolase n=1 Tax=Plantactinospora mayteni TaxID=566021 RepID=A0ABQ4EXP5_9ACTN|nr:amidohydrolase [Plantactinospora mayteni]GIG99437.1 hippurate hydrolase [Plantactinospora mayteni]